MPVKTRRSDKVRSSRRFRTRPCNQSVVVLIDPTYQNISLMSDVIFDDNFGAKSPTPKKTRKPRRPEAPKEKLNIVDIIEEDEDEAHDDDGYNKNNIENIPPDDEHDSDRSAAERMNAEFEKAEDFSWYLENQDGVRVKNIGNKLVDYESYAGHKTTANILPPPPPRPKTPTEAELKAERHSLRKAVCEYMRTLTPVKVSKSSPMNLTVYSAVRTGLQMDSSAFGRIRRTTRSVAPEPIAETSENECTESLMTPSNQPGANLTAVMHKSSDTAMSVTPKSRLSIPVTRRSKSNLLTASLFSIDGSNTMPISQPTQHDTSFPSFSEIADMKAPVMSSTPVLQKQAPQAHSTPFEEDHGATHEDIVEKSFDLSSPRFQNVTLRRRSRERALSRQSQEISPVVKSSRPSLTQDSFDDNNANVLPPSPAPPKDSIAIDAASDTLPGDNEEDKLAALLDSSMDFSSCRSEPNTSFNSLATLAEDVPFQITRNVGNMTRNVTQMTTTYRNVSHLTNASFLEIPFYLYGCPDAATATPLAKLLHVIGQPEVFDWVQLPDDVFANPKKLGEGTYGEVFATSYKGQSTALKVIPFVGDKVTYSGTVNGEYLMNAEAILPEVLIIRELSALYDPSADYSTPNFIQLLKTNVVQGHYPSSFLAAWDEFDEVKGSENDRPSEYTTKEQLFVTIGMAMGGVALEDYKMENEGQAVSALLQVALSLAVAEERLEFEHRDLHNGNVLIMETDTDLEYKFGGGTMIVRSYGIKVSLIDFTLSRMSKEGTTIFRNLEDDEELFTGTNDYQFDIYRMMRDETDGNWASFKRKTNCLWLHYLSRYIIGKGFKKSKGKKRSRALQRIWDQVLNFESIRDIFTSDEFMELLETHLEVQARAVS